jgi:hypothetical protein
MMVRPTLAILVLSGSVFGLRYFVRTIADVCQDALHLYLFMTISGPVHDPLCFSVMI